MTGYRCVGSSLLVQLVLSLSTCDEDFDVGPIGLGYLEKGTPTCGGQCRGLDVAGQSRGGDESDIDDEGLCVCVLLYCRPMVWMIVGL